MIKSKFVSLRVGLFALALGLAASSSALANATITIQNNDAAGVGFNDPTPATPVGGNSGTTVGQQRLNAFNFAASIWGATIDSSQVIVIRASWAPLLCNAPDDIVLGSAGSFEIDRDFPNAPFPNTWYSSALANKFANTDLNGSDPEITAEFNLSIGTPSCLQNNPWYYGLDGNEGNGFDLVSVLLHEFAHGLGFQTFTNRTTGNPANGFFSVFDRFLRDNTTGKLWIDMNNTERVASAINDGNLVWAGPQVTADVPSVLVGTPRLRINSPGAIAGNYTIGTAEFGADLSSTGITANVVRALDPADGIGPTTTDGCSAFTNSAAIAGNIAFINRGNCDFTVKVKNAQNAGAVGVVIGNVSTSNSANTPPQMGGNDPTIIIPAVSLAFLDAEAIRAQLVGVVNGSILLDPTARSGADSANRALMYAPNPFERGSSTGHFDVRAFPDLLMEPAISDDLTHSVIPPQDLTFSLLRDIGWTGSPQTGGNPIDDTTFFVRQHYIDFLNREPDAAGLTFWTDQINSCGADAQCREVKRINVSASFFLSIEFQETGYLAYRVYKTAFSNLTTPPGAPVPITLNDFLRDTQQIGNNVQVNVGNWQAQLEANKQAYMLAFVQRSDFLSNYPLSMSATNFVTQLNNRAGGVLSQAEQTNLINTLAPNPQSATLRAQVLRSVAEDPDLYAAEFRKAFVLMQYFGYLRRNPNDSPEPNLNFDGFNFWLNKLNQFNGDYLGAEMVKAFISSTEYRGRFAP